MKTYYVFWTYLANYNSNSKGESYFAEVEAESIEDAISKAYYYDEYEDERGNKVTFHVLDKKPVYSGSHPSIQ